ncbi:ATPase [Aureococcus anophagefferens]|nr:ATPase [Aureococcus anophagefferens]
MMAAWLIQGGSRGTAAMMLPKIAVLALVAAVRGANLTGTFPTFVAGDLDGNFNISILGSGFENRSSSSEITCHLRGGLNAAAESPGADFPREIPAFVESDSEVLCELPPYAVNLETRRGLGGPQQPLRGQSANFSWRQLVEATPARRPSSRRTRRASSGSTPRRGGVAPTAKDHSVEICRSTPEWRSCDVVPFARGGAAVKIDLGVDVGEVNADLAIDATFLPSETKLATKKRRLVVVKPPPATYAGAFTVVDHARRAIAALEDVATLSSLGTNHLVAYGGDANDDDLGAFVAACEAHGVMFDFSLVWKVIPVLNATTGGNTTEKWANLTKSADRVRNSPSLVGYYTCDDCDNGALYTSAGLAEVYDQLKLRDPYHLHFGADWSQPWANYAWSVAVGASVENYKPDPKQLLNDARNRDGMRFEPLINSPGMYLMGPAPFPPNVTTSGYPAVLEATQGWMSTMTYDAPGQLNFLYETRRHAAAGAPFCAYVVVANLEPTPSTYALAFAEGVLPDAAKVAYHEFRATYNVTVARGDDGAATIDDVLTGFGSALYRLGDC